MSDEITRELFDHLAELAALELNDAESEALRRQLNNQLNVIHELAQIDVTGVPAAAHGVPYPPHVRQPLRADEASPRADPDALLALAPELDERYIVVPDIPHTELV